MAERFTPDRITSLGENEIFVFGSNLAGTHGGGAALLAYRKFGAIWGQGVGLQGQSYGIPTMQGGVETIVPYVDEFIAFAKDHPELTFFSSSRRSAVASLASPRPKSVRCSKTPTASPISSSLAGGKKRLVSISLAERFCRLITLQKSGIKGKYCYY